MNMRRISLFLILCLTVLLTHHPLCAQGGPDKDPSTRPDKKVVKTVLRKPAIRWQVWPGQSGKKYTIGSLNDESGYLFRVELISDGAAINTVKLAKFFFDVEDKRTADADIEAHHEQLRKHPGQAFGHYCLMNPVSNKGKRNLPLSTRKITLTLADGTTASWNLDTLPWSLVGKSTNKADEESISFFWQLYRGDSDHPVIKLVKTYTVRKNDYTIGVSLRMENLSDKVLTVAIDQAGPTGLPREGHRADERKAAYGKFISEKEEQGKVQAMLKPRETDLEELDFGKKVSVGTSSSQQPVLWIGQANKFFASMMYLVPTIEGRLQAPAWNADFYTEDALENDTSPTHLTGVQIPKIKLEPKQSSEIRFELFAGPKQREMFIDSGAPYHKDRYKVLDYISTIDLGGCFCAWDWLSMSMIRLLKLISKITFGNFGIAIIVLVIIVRLILHPLTKKGQVSMAGMKKLGPMMKELEKKYADDKDALNRERLKMYKTQGFTPLMGCLPMLLQMPILIALWTGINASMDLRHAAFLPVWIIDLAAPDALFSWAKDIPLIGKSFNLIPILLGGAMYWQMKLSPSANQPGATAEQQKQQKMMAFMMPLMMPILFYNAASGLTLYFMVSTFFGAAEQQIIRRHIEAEEAQTAAMETTVQIPGKGPRESRPKKPKGPFFVKRG